jgi:hypothetical protein
LSCNEHTKVDKPIIMKKADINILSRFSLNYKSNLICDSNSLIYYKSVPFDTSFIIHIVKEDTLFKGVCYFVPRINNQGLFFDESSKNGFLFGGFNFILNMQEWQKIKTEYKNLQLLLEKKVCFDCLFMFVSTDGHIKSGYLENKNPFDDFILKEVIHFYLPRS